VFAPSYSYGPKVCRSIVGSVPRDHRVSKKSFGQKRCAEHFCGACGYSDQSCRGVSDPSLSNAYICHEYRGVATRLAQLPGPVVKTSGRRDSNPGPPAPKAGALTKLRYAPLPLTYSQRRYYLDFGALFARLVLEM
jgi:hypothetical protein